MHSSVQDAETVSTATNGSERLPDGRFAPGNRAASGRRSRSASLRRAFEAAVTEESIEALAESMLQAARLGDVSAAKLITDQVLAKPNIEALVAERIAEWKSAFIQELLYSTDAESLRQRLVGYTTSSNKQTDELLALLSRLEAFSDVYDCT